jgi:S-adenosylmethionine/arginine decarboxylase-like enzyme
MLDCFDCQPGIADNLEATYRYLEELVNLLGMTKMAPPIVIHGPRDPQGNELFPDKAGVSGWVPLIESGIQLHGLEPTRFITIDVYSCRIFDPFVVRVFTEGFFRPANITHQFCERGNATNNCPPV